MSGKKKSLALVDPKWTYEAYAYVYEVSLDKEGNLHQEARHIREPARSPEKKTMPWWDLLRSISLGEVAIEVEIIRYAIEHLERPSPDVLGEHERARFAFWERFDPERVTRLEGRAEPSEATSAHDLWTAPEGFYYRNVYYNDAILIRWDEVYFHGPVWGGTSLEFRRRLREMLLDAVGVGEHEEPPPAIFPLLDYDRLPDDVWSSGDDVRGSRSHFEKGHYVHMGWDNTGRPEGGRMDYGIEKLFTNDFAIQTDIPRDLLPELLAAALVE